MKTGISRQGLEPQWIARESAKSNLLLRARLLQAQGETENALALYLQAAEIEEELADYCSTIGLHEKSHIHRFGAASCWAKVGELQRALRICEVLLLESALSEPIRKAVEDFAGTLRERRRRWLVFWQDVQNAQDQQLGDAIPPTLAVRN